MGALGRTLTHFSHSMISIVICTHNPREDYLQRVLSALKEQTLPKTEWELLLVDNASNIQLTGKWDLSWHPSSRIIREDQLGLTAARLRAIEEAQGNLLVFVDDDCELKSDYIEKTYEIENNHKNIGIWSGQCHPVYEIAPPAWLLPYRNFLCAREFNENKWSNIPTNEDSMPWGAGLSVRKIVARQYKKTVSNCKIALSLGRKGKDLYACEDIDIVFTSIELNLGFGIFSCLELNHLIPKQRIQIEYICRAIEGHAYSWNVLCARRGQRKNIVKIKPLRKLLGRIKRRIFMDKITRAIFEAKIDGEQKAITDLNKWFQ
jgi:glycosyltransferase involved in cell wall biosynthesis